MSLEAWGDEPWGAEDEPDIERLLGKGFRSADDMTKAAHDVIDERLRQRDVEGWTPEHDDDHNQGQLGRAALSYVAAASITTALTAANYAAGPPLDGMGHAISWPWDPRWWKPGSSRRMLVKAAALILAEIERLDRLEAKSSA